MYIFQNFGIVHVLCTAINVVRGKYSNSMYLVKNFIDKQIRILFIYLSSTFSVGEQITSRKVS